MSQVGRRRFRLRVEKLEDRCVPANIPVTTLDENGVGSLRAAITTANNQAGDDVITFAGGLTGSIVLSSALPPLSSNLQIQGPGASVLSVVRSSAAGDFRIFTVTDTVTVTVFGLTLSKGRTPVASASLNDGTLTLSDCILADNIATQDSGGAVYNTGTLTVTNSIFTRNEADSGGGIFNDGTLTVQNSTFFANRTRAQNGGGIANTGRLTVQNSTLSNNSAEGGGGGIFTAGVTATLVHVTLTGNRAAANGIGGSGGGLFVSSNGVGPVTLTNTLVAGNFRGIGNGRSDVAGAVASASAGNLIGDGTGLSVLSDGVNGNQVGTAANPIDPRLGPLQNNGGPTPTHVLLPGSPALNAASASRAQPTDQRGLPRDGAPDVGAFEFVLPPPPPPPPPPPRPSVQIAAAAFRKKGIAKVRVTNAATGAVRKILTPFPGFDGRLRLSMLDVNGDGSRDLVVMGVLNGKLKKKVYDASTLTLL